ncbi:MAG: c-type cytochrome [Acidobacteria bacterium]|nr:c-type cytochrome [Acidobacteriota bacterium]
MRLLALLIAAPLLGQAPAQAPAAPAFDSHAFFLQSCAGCHGQDGSATRPDGSKGRAADLTNAAWQKANSDAAIAHAILEGKGHMPAFKGRLSEADALKLVSEVVRNLHKGTPVKAGN